jgi:hypothetical protein
MGVKTHTQMATMAYYQIITLIEWGVQQLGRVLKIGPPEEGGDFQVFDPAKEGAHFISLPVVLPYHPCRLFI